MDKISEEIGNFKVKSVLLSGSSLPEIKKKAERYFAELKRKSKRTPYVRAAYFNREKVFLNYFWDHLKNKSPKERTKRLKLLPCAIELIKLSRHKPKVIVNKHNHSELLYRFTGRLPDNQVFYVQIKENLKSGKKYLMSFFLD